MTITFVNGQCTTCGKTQSWCLCDSGVISDPTLARQIILSATYAEKQQAAVDCMLLTWAEADAGDYGFRGYETVNKLFRDADTETRIDLANAIKDRRIDAQEQ